MEKPLLTAFLWLLPREGCNDILCSALSWILKSGSVLFVCPLFRAAWSLNSRLSSHPDTVWWSHIVDELWSSCPPLSARQCWWTAYMPPREKRQENTPELSIKIAHSQLPDTGLRFLYNWSLLLTSFMLCVASSLLCLLGWQSDRLKGSEKTNEKISQFNTTGCFVGGVQKLIRKGSPHSV